MVIRDDERAQFAELTDRLDRALRGVDELIAASNTERAFRFEIVRSHLLQAVASVEEELIKRYPN